MRRLMVDHLLYPAASSPVAEWLRSQLGDQSVVDGVANTHKKLIKHFGDRFFVIAGRITFSGQGFDPAYRYVTYIQHPVDRALDFLFFVLNQSGAEISSDLYAAASQFLYATQPLTADDSACKILKPYISNVYVTHFSEIGPSHPQTEIEKIEKALWAIGKYDIWGFSENMPVLFSSLAEILGLPMPDKTYGTDMNVGLIQREQVGTHVIAALEAMNTSDISFYDRLQAQNSKPDEQPLEATWLPYDVSENCCFSVPEFILIDAMLGGSQTFLPGHIMDFAFNFSLSVALDVLDIQIYLFDEKGNLAFSTSNTILGNPLKNLLPRCYQERFAIVANLPIGVYRVGIGFIGEQSTHRQEMARFSRILTFQIVDDPARDSCGYMHLSAACRTNSSLYPEPVLPMTDGRGVAIFSASLGDIVTQDMLTIPVSIVNKSVSEWLNFNQNKISVSYQWIDSNHQKIDTESIKTPLPVDRLSPGAQIDVTLSVLAPDIPGEYRLLIIPVQDFVDSFDKIGFTSLEISTQVIAPNVKRYYPANDPRFFGQVSYIEHGRRVSNGHDGYFLFGPYVSIAPGSWRAVFEGFFNIEKGNITVDAVIRRGEVISLESIESSCDQIELVFRIEGIVNDLELRIEQQGSVQIQLDAIRLFPLLDN